MELYVILVNGQPSRTNDQDDRYILCRSKAHGLRTIKWIGLAGAKVAKATPEQIANGLYSPVHGKRYGETDKSNDVESFIGELINS